MSPLFPPQDSSTRLTIFLPRWNSSTTTWPRVLDSAGCWNGKPPPTGDLILGALDTFARPQDEEEGVKWKAYFRGEESADVDPRRAVTQLLEPSKLPVSIIGLTLPATIGENYFRAAPELSEFVEVIDERHKQLLLTPKYSLTDLHIGKFSIFKPQHFRETNME
jgi:hypothetical protein